MVNYCLFSVMYTVSSMLILSIACSYIWLKSDGKGEKKELLSQALQPQTSEGWLVFDRLSMNHDGYYVCQACFNKEFIESDEVKLTVTMAGGTYSMMHEQIKGAV